MQKLKDIVSHTHRKSQDAATMDPNSDRPAEDASHVRTQHEHHPIYDQMTSQSPTAHTSSQPLAPDQGPGEPHNYSGSNRSAKTDAGSGPAGAQQAQRNLQPQKSHHSRGAGSDDVSSASIKSGVLGYPQVSGDAHASLRNDDTTQRNLAGNQVLGEGNEPARRDETVTNPGNTTHRENDERRQDGARLGETQQGEESLNQNSAAYGTERSFPLAGGVKKVEKPAQTTATSGREPGTKEKEVGLRDGQGRERLAGAAAAATAARAIPTSHGENITTEQSSALGSDKAATSAIPGPRLEHIPSEQPSELGLNRTGNNYHHTEALAAATTPASNTRSASLASQEHANMGNSTPTNQTGTTGQASSGPLSTQGPHHTGAGNLFDPNVSTPHLHIPGEFPSPTPVDESHEPSYMTSKGASSTPFSNVPGTHQKVNHTDTLDAPKTGMSAGVGAYAAGKSHQDSPQVGNEVLTSRPSPYSSTKIDPRVDSEPRSTTTNTQDPVRDAPSTVGAQPPVPETSKSNLEHHYGRDAALLGAGAGAGTTAGLYAAQRSNEPDSGPASSTIGPHKSNAANIIDPRVQPDPKYQKHHAAAPTTDDPAPSTVGPHKSDLANIVDPRVQPDPKKQKAAPKQESTGDRNAATTAAIGGTAATGGVEAPNARSEVGEVAEAYAHHPLTQPTASLDEQRYDPTAPSAKAPSPIPTLIRSKEEPRESHHHYGRDAAVAGGLGTAGAGAYAATTHGNDRAQQQSLSTFQQPTQVGPGGTTRDSSHHYGRDTAAAGGLGAAGAGAYAVTRGNDHAQFSNTHQPPQVSHNTLNRDPAHQRYDSVQDPSKQQQYQYSHSEQQHDKRNIAAGTVAGAAAGAGGAYALSSEHSDAMKAHEQQLKVQQKAFGAQQRQQEKDLHTQQQQAAKEQKHHDKQVALNEKHHAKHLENEQPLQHEQDKEKKHLLPFLHRDKNSEDANKTSGTSLESSPRASVDSPRGSKDLHRHRHQHSDSDTNSSETGGLGKRERHRLHKDPPPGHPAREAMEHEKYLHQQQQQYAQFGQYGRVTEPHTGLPTNVSKFGTDGQGGTDGSATVGGFYPHQGQHQAEGLPQGPTTTAMTTTSDWEKARE